MREISTLLERLSRDERAAADELFSIFYEDLSRIARIRLSANGRDHAFDTALLVHEAYLKFIKTKQLRLNDQNHFLAYAAATFRSVVVDFARRSRTEQRGGGVHVVTLNTEIAESVGALDAEVLAVHEALEILEQIDPRLVQVVEMRYFAGLTDCEVAEALGVSDRTVRRDWDRARLLLSDILES